MNGYPKCTECGSDMGLLMMQSLHEIGVPCDLLKCLNWQCHEYHMALYDDNQNIIQLYRIDRDEKENYRRLARRHRIAKGEW